MLWGGASKNLSDGGEASAAISGGGADEGFHAAQGIELALVFFGPFEGIWGRRGRRGIGPVHRGVLLQAFAFARAREITAGAAFMLAMVAR
jgi:hypothetical protein